MDMSHDFVRAIIIYICNSFPRYVKHSRHAWQHKQINTLRKYIR